MFLRTAPIGKFSLSVAYAQRCHPGERVCGDAFALFETGERMLVCIVDGAGHGEDAKTAADAFVAYIQKNLESSIQDLLLGAHAMLRNTRGGVASLLSLGPDAMEFAGVGNVALRAWTQHGFDAFPTPGMLGVRLPSVRKFRVPVVAGDFVVLYSDGVTGPLRMPRAFASLPLRELSQQMLELNATDRDDCTLAMVRVATRDEELPS